MLGIVGSLIPGLAILAYGLRLYPLNWSGSWTGYHPDMPFFQAISVMLARHGAFSSPFMPDTSLRYHWLSYAWAGQLEVSANAAPFAVLTRVLPLVALLGTVPLAVSWAARLSPQRWVPLLAGLLLTIGGYVGAVFGGVLTLDSPSQALSALWLLGFAVASVEILNRGRATAGSALLLLVLAFCLVGGKVSAALPAVIGVLVASAVVFLQRPQARPAAVVLLGVSLIGTAAGYLFFLVGASGGGGLTLGSIVDRSSSQQGLNPTTGWQGVAIGTCLLVLAVLPRWMGATWLLAIPRWRQRSEPWFAVGLALTAVGALLTFNSFNELWFSAAVSAPLAVVSAVGAGEALATLVHRGKKTPAIILIVACSAAAAIFAIVWALWATGPSGGNTFVATLRWLGPPAAWVLAIAAGVGLVLWCCSRLSIRAVAAGALIVLVLVSVPGRLLGAGSGMTGTLDNGLRREWFSFGYGPSVRHLDTSIVTDWTQERIRASQWLREHADPNDLVVTNLTFGTFVAGTTNLPTFVSGIQYQAPYGVEQTSTRLLSHEALAWAWIDRPDAVTLAPLCASGVRWAWIDPSLTRTRSWGESTEIAYSTSQSIILKINCPANRTA